MIRVVVAHSDRIVRECLAEALSRDGQIAVAGLCEGDDLPTLIGSIHAHEPDVVIVNNALVRTPIAELFKDSRTVVPAARVLVIGVPNHDPEILAAVEAGAAGYVTRDSSLEDLIANVLALSAGQTLCSPRVASLLFSRLANVAPVRLRPTGNSNEPQLTRRELQIVALIELGMSNKEIARRLTLGVQTVKNHVHNVLEKLHVQRRVEAARFARARGLLAHGTGTSTGSKLARFSPSTLVSCPSPGSSSEPFGPSPILHAQGTLPQNVAGVTVIKILLSVAHPSIIEQRLRPVLRQEADMEVIEGTADPIGLLVMVGEMRPDAVALTLERDDQLGVVSHLLSEYPDLTILALRDPAALIVQRCSCQRTVEDTSPRGLINALCDAMENPCEFERASP